MGMDVPDGKMFDTAAFVGVLEAKRAQDQISWREVARACDLSASTLTRLRQGTTPDIETFARLCAWASVPPDQFIRSAEVAHETAEEPLVGIAALLRSDPSLSPDDVEVMEAMIQATYAQFRNRSQ